MSAPSFVSRHYTSFLAAIGCLVAASPGRMVGESIRSPNGEVTLSAVPGVDGGLDVRASFVRQTVLLGLVLKTETAQPGRFISMESPAPTVRTTEALSGSARFADLGFRALHPANVALEVTLRVLDEGVAFSAGFRASDGRWRQHSTKLMLRFPSDTIAWLADQSGHRTSQKLRSSVNQTAATLPLMLPSGQCGLLFVTGAETTADPPPIRTQAESVEIILPESDERVWLVLLLGQRQQELFGRHQDLVAVSGFAESWGRLPPAARHSSRAFGIGVPPASMTHHARDVALAIVDFDANQSAIDRPEALRRSKDWADEFLQRIPGNWDESRVLDAAIAQRVTIARRSKADWWLGMISAESIAVQPLPLRFLDRDRIYVAHMISDDPARSESAPSHRTQKVTSEDTLSLSLKNAGGIAVWITPDRKSR